MVLYSSFTVNFVRDITLKQKISTRNLVGWYISLSRSAVHKNRNSALPNFEVIALCSFWHFELGSEHNSKLQAISTIIFVGRYMSFSRSELHTNHYPALPNFGVTALYSFLHFKLCPDHSMLKNRNLSLSYFRIITPWSLSRLLLKRAFQILALLISFVMTVNINGKTCTTDKRQCLSTYYECPRTNNCANIKSLI